MSFSSSLNNIETSAGNWIKQNQDHVQYASIVDLSSMTTTAYFSPNRILAENNAATGSGVTLKVEAEKNSIRELREVSGLTWEQLSNLFGVSRRALHLWDTGHAMTPSNQEKLSRLVNAVRSFDTGDSNENRRILLTGIGGQIPLDLLRESKFDQFKNLKEFFVPRNVRPSVSTAESIARAPLSPGILVDARYEMIHQEKRKSRPIMSKKLKKA